MRVFVSTIEILYLGEEDYIYNHKGRKYTLKKGDILVMSDDYYAKYLLKKPLFKLKNKNKKNKAKEPKEETQEETQEEVQEEVQDSSIFE